jgi:hypothetical protein
MSTPNTTPEAKQQDGDLAANKPDIDVTTLIHAKRSSHQRFKALVQYYRSLGVTDKDIVAAMISSPLMINSLGRR